MSTKHISVDCDQLNSVVFHKALCDVCDQLDSVVVHKALCDVCDQLNSVVVRKALCTDTDQLNSLHSITGCKSLSKLKYWSTYTCS